MPSVVVISLSEFCQVLLEEQLVLGQMKDPPISLFLLQPWPIICTCEGK